jgi:hypothetical protein
MLAHMRIETIRYELWLSIDVIVIEVMAGNEI